MVRRLVATVAGCIAISVAAAWLAECPCYADQDERSCPKGESKTDEGCIKNPTPRHKVTPVYPKEARRERAEGHVTLQARVMEDGTVSDVEVKKSTNPGHGFEDAAMDALKKWRYKPGTLNGKPTPVYFTVTIDFLP